MGGESKEHPAIFYLVISQQNFISRQSTDTV
ncbi:MAG: hypothetical protein ACI8Q1_000732 [Parvicella sp.]|jgi:hypothetical protein